MLQLIVGLGARQQSPMYTVCWFPWRVVETLRVSGRLAIVCACRETVVSHRDCVVSTSQDGEPGFLGVCMLLPMPLVSGSVPDGRQQTNHPPHHAPRAGSTSSNSLILSQHGHHANLLDLMTKVREIRGGQRRGSWYISSQVTCYM